jgi:3-oxoacyl-[acyl-carrier-protein] synthase II
MNHLPETSVCVTGMGICLPVARGRAAVARALIGGQDAIGPVKSFDGSKLASCLVSEFDPSAQADFGLPADELALLDRGTWFALDAFGEALAQSGLADAGYAPERIGVVLGTSHAGIQHIERSFLHLRGSGNGPVPAHWLHAASPDQSASVIAARLGARGPKATISSACASSNTAVGVGLDWLVRGEVDCVVVIGTDTVSPSILGGFNALRAVSPSPAAPFSGPAGITLGEGAGALILEREGAARARSAQPLAWVRGYGLSGDAYHETATDTEGRGVEAAMRAALADAGINGSAIDYVSAHGTGTDANDIPEAIATARVVGESTPLSSPKSFLGHTLGASGVVEMIVTLLFADEGLIPPTRHFTEPRKGCPPLNYVPNTPQAHAVTTFLCNNYGFGGNNSSLVISRRAGPTAQRAPAAGVVLVGAGTLGAFGHGRQAFFDKAWAGETFTPDTAWNWPAARADKSLAGLKLRGNSRASTMIKSAIASVDEALAAAGGQALVQAAPQRCALIAGVTHGAIKHVEKLMASIFDEGIQYASATHFPLTTMNATGGQISIAYGVKGFNTTFCGSGAALQYAHSIVQDGRQDRAITFGADELSPLVLRAVADCGHFDHADDALAGVPGEGAAALVLENEALAAARGATALARIEGLSATQDHVADRLGATGQSLARAARQALQQAGIGAGAIDAVITLGHGPARVREAETAALHSVFGNSLPPATSAAGLAGLCPSALLPLHLLLGAEVLARRSLPPAAAGGAVRALPRAERVLVLHNSFGGEYLAVVLGATNGERV